MPEADDAQLISTYRPCGTSLVVYAHIHRPYVRRVGGLTVANSGSVGSPFDGDPRAAYLLIDAGRPQVVRVEYDVEREVSLLLRFGHPDARGSPTRDGRGDSSGSGASAEMDGGVAEVARVAATHERFYIDPKLDPPQACAASTP